MVDDSGNRDFKPETVFSLSLVICCDMGNAFSFSLSFGKNNQFNCAIIYETEICNSKLKVENFCNTSKEFSQEISILFHTTLKLSVFSIFILKSKRSIMISFYVPVLSYKGESQAGINDAYVNGTFSKQLFLTFFRFFLAHRLGKP